MSKVFETIIYTHQGQACTEQYGKTEEESIDKAFLAFENSYTGLELEDAVQSITEIKTFELSVQ